MQAGQNIQSLPPNGYGRTEQSSFSEGDIAAEPTEGKKGGLKLRPLLAIVWRNIPLILGMTAAGGLVGYMLHQSAPPVFQGSFSILVEPITSQARSTDPSAISRASATQEATAGTVDYPTLLQVLQSPELLSKISAQIQSRYPKVTPNSLANDLKNQDFIVSRVGTNLLDSTRTLDVTYKGTDSEQVQFVLEKLAEGYLRFSLEDRKTRIGGGVEFIEDQLPGLQQRVNTLEAQIQSIRQRYRFMDPSVESQQIADQLKDVRQRKLEAKTLLKEQSTLYTNLQRQIGLTPEQSLAAASLSQNPRYQDLLAQLKKVDSQIAISLARFNEESPTVKRLREQQRNLNQLLNQEARKNLSETYPDVPDTARVVAYQDPLRLELIRQMVASANQAQALQARSNEITRRENDLDQRLEELPAIVRQYNSLTQQLTIATQTLNQFLLQRETLRVEAAQKEVPWEIISKPKLVTSPFSGRVIATRGKKADQTFMMCLGAGLILGLLAALLREKLRNVFVTPQDVQDAMALPFLGTVPFKKASFSWSDVSSGKASDSLFSEAFSSLYTNLRFLNPNLLVHSMTVGSVEPGDGKTTVALHLAQAAAAMGQHVLLVDANLRDPQVHTLLDLKNQKGLTDLLGQKASLEEVIQRMPFESNLSVLTSGTVQNGSTKLFASNEMQSLVKQLQSQYDLVIYDTPALEGLTDTNFLTSLTDGMLMVVGVNKTKRSKFNQSLDSLKKYHLSVIGVLANHPGKGNIFSTPASSQLVGSQVPPAFLGNLKQSSEVTH